MAAEHTVKAYDEELDRMDNAILEMGGIVEQQLADSIVALVRRDDDLASRVITEDRRVDALEAEIDQLAVRILALRQPVAVDLRVITASLKVASDLERMGDYAANVAKRSIAIQDIDPIRLTHAISRMAGIAHGMIKDVLDSFRDRDVERAMAVWRVPRGRRRAAPWAGALAASGDQPDLGDLHDADCDHHIPGIPQDVGNWRLFRHSRRVHCTLVAGQADDFRQRGAGGADLRVEGHGRFP